MEVLYDHAGQIFCEMLGQTCYKEFFENNEMKYQEVSSLLSIMSLTSSKAFVIYANHSSVTIYYAHLPNLYLREISKYGKKYNTCRTFQRQIQLRRTKKHSLRNTSERVELFILLAKLLSYLISGRSHVGYLYDYNDNPLHKIVFHPSTKLIIGANCL
jgi:hypothetical protein